MKSITINSGTVYGKEVSGTFPFIRILSPSPSDKSIKREKYVHVIMDGKQKTVQVFTKDIIIHGDHNTSLLPVSTVVQELSDDDLSKVINKRFDIMDRMAEGVVDGSVRALIVSGAAGVGKTFGLEKRMRDAFSKGEIGQFTHLKGKITGMALFAQLFLHRNKGDVIMFDDIDSVFGDETSLNILKTALDTGVRNLSWKSGSTWLSDNGIDDEFDFEGSVIFITNIDFDRKIERGSSDAVHFKALISRSNYLDLKVQSAREVFLRLKWIVTHTNIIKDNGLTKQQGEEIIAWLDSNKEKMREISIRSVLKLASYIKSDTIDWVDTAEIMMLK